MLIKRSACIFPGKKEKEIQKGEKVTNEGSQQSEEVFFPERTPLLYGWKGQVKPNQTKRVA